MKRNNLSASPLPYWKARVQRIPGIASRRLVLVVGLCSVTCDGQTATLTTLNLSSNTISHGSALTLTAKVTAGSTAVSPGVINFCNSSASSCTGPGLVGTAQLANAGTSSIQIIPGIGTHSYKAVFSGTTTYALSTSGAPAVIVTGTFPSTTTITSSGAAGDYTLTGTVAATGLLTAPTGSVAFQDSSNSNYALGSSTLGASTPSMAFAMGSADIMTNGPRNSVSGDFNGDGIPDLAIAGGAANTLSVLLGNGDGTFTAAPGSPIALQSNVIGVAVGDFNNDGKLDIVATCYGSGTMATLLGNGDGTYRAPVYVSVGYSAEAIAVGDLNHDGNLDVAIANQVFNRVLVLRGDGTGAFPSSSTLATGSQPYSIALADLDGSGSLDMVVGNATANKLYVFLNNGSGSFTVANGSPIALSSDSYMVAAGDFRGNGIMDLVVVDNGGNTLEVLLGNGNGTFQSPASITGTASGAKFVTVGDYNGDGELDFATCDAAGTIGIYFGNGDGTFQAASILSTGARNCLYIVTADFDGDGFPDLDATIYSNRSSVVYLSRPAETAAASISSVDVPGAGLHTVDAVYAGDSHFASSTSNTTALTASKVVTTSTVYVAPTSSQYGQQVALSAVLTPYLVGSLSTNGEVITFMNGGIRLGTGTLASGLATLNLTALPAGSDSLIAVYPGDTNYLTSTSATVSYNVARATPTISFVVANQTYGVSPFAVLATSNATGAISYTVVSGPATISGSTVTLTGAGSVVLQSTQAASGNFAAGTQNASFTAATAVPTILLTTSASPAAYGAGVTFTATLPSDATGTVTFLDGATAVGTGSIGGGVATFSAWSLRGGTHSITATWPGNANYLGGTSLPWSETIVRSAVTIALHSSVNPSSYGDPLLLTAIFSGPGAAPTGTAVVMDGLTTLATVTLDSSGTATYTVGGLIAASHVLSVTYNGDTNYF